MPARQLDVSPDRGRLGPRDGTSEAEITIFAATERLLEKVPLHEISVAQIIAEAGISRATFYFYFSSKFSVVSRLLARVMDEVYEAVRPFRDRTPDEPRDRVLRRSLEASASVWSSHRAVLRAAAEHWHAIPELRDIWLGLVDRFTQALANDINHERAEGFAPAGPDSRRLAATLIWTTERCLYVAGLGDDGQLADERATVDTITALWVGAVYGRQPADSLRA